MAPVRKAFADTIDAVMAEAYVTLGLLSALGDVLDADPLEGRHMKQLYALVRSARRSVRVIHRHGNRLEHMAMELSPSTRKERA